MLTVEYNVIENYENRDTVTHLNAKQESTVVVVSEPAEGLAMCVQENCKGLMSSCILQQLPQQQVHSFKDIQLARFDRNTPVEILYPRATRKFLQKEVLKVA
ncbi:MAG: hypothetical protein EZS28_034359 [Streblomastix strix]|uniref:Uncharacterized protein n=1 Tax=Streblomastix strix TaxID=222440 RepID=A0A5J4UK87_9EUKA|nr:MAG: hypothetical protein EZS28_034359 [Streblomastix strix]